MKRLFDRTPTGRQIRRTNLLRTTYSKTDKPMGKYWKLRLKQFFSNKTNVVIFGCLSCVLLFLLISLISRVTGSNILFNYNTGDSTNRNDNINNLLIYANQTLNLNNAKNIEIAKKRLESLLNQKTSLEGQLQQIEEQIRNNKLFKHLSKEIDHEKQNIPNNNKNNNKNRNNNNDQNKQKTDNTANNSKNQKNSDKSNKHDSNKSRLEQIDASQAQSDSNTINKDANNPNTPNSPNNPKNANNGDNNNDKTDKTDKTAKTDTNDIDNNQKNNQKTNENIETLDETDKTEYETDDSSLPDIFPSLEDSKKLKDASTIRKEIIEEFRYCWDSYKKCAWGHDTLHPISCRGSDSNFNMGLTMIDSLDTMILMAQNDDSTLFDEVNSAKDWINNHLTYNHNDISLFESTIRLLGGLLSSYHLTNDKIYLNKAKELGDALLIAYNTETGIPYATVDMKKRRAYHPSWARSSMSTSEAGTVQLEMNYLSYLTQDPVYSEKAMIAQNKIITAMENSHPPLLRKFISTKNGQFTDSTMSIGGRIDSTYEYFLKVYLQLGMHKQYEHVWKAYVESMENIESYLFRYSKPSNYLYVAELHNTQITNQFDHLACFIGGTLAQGSIFEEKKLGGIESGGGYKKRMKYAKEVTKSCAAMYFGNPTGLSPEIVFWNDGEDSSKDYDIHRNDKFSILRPETVESIFYMWRATHDVRYRQWAYTIFDNFRKYAKIDSGGYSSIKDVTVGSKEQVSYRDELESFFLGETMKYLYLTFCDDDVMDINKYVFNTEAHPFPMLTKDDVENLLIK